MYKFFNGLIIYMNEQDKIQQIRKDNLRAIIKSRFGGKVDGFANQLGKSKYVIYAMLWDTTNLNHRKITDQFARAIEQKLNLAVFSLDSIDDQNPDDGNIIIPLIDYQESNSMQDLHIHTLDQIKLPKEMFLNINSVQDLIGFKVPDMDMFPSYSIGDIVIVNRFKRVVEDGHAYLVRIDGKFYIRTLRTVNNVLQVVSLNNELQLEPNSNRIKIYGIVDVEIRKKLYRGN